ncbi:MAG TPA: hypothetical protein VIY29_09625 [Ktedonobacteraceae bacterium]
MWKEIQRYIPRDHAVALTPGEVTDIVADQVPRHHTLEQTKRFAEYLSGLPQVVGKNEHYFGDGTYTRLWIGPAHTVTIGKMHRLRHTMAVLAGEVSLSTEQGFIRVRGPYVEEARAGTKRIVVCHTECAIITVHPNPTNTRDLAELEKQLIVDPDSIIDG